jgi:ribonuclease G
VGRYKKKGKKGSVPRLLYEEPDLLERIIRDNMIDDVSRLILNDGNEFKKVKRFLKKHDPELLGRVELFKEGFEVFENFGIEQEITRALHRKVWLKNGAYLVIDRTEALTVIDVNTGKFTGKKSLEDTVFKVNKEAATEIARQLRIRDVGGIIVIDFIDMEIQDHRKKVIETLEMALKRDKSKTEVFGMTKLGLVEMTRKKVRQELSTILNTKCMECNGFGKTLSPVTIARTLEKTNIIISCTYKEKEN